MPVAGLRIEVRLARHHMHGLTPMMLREMINDRPQSLVGHFPPVADRVTSPIPADLSRTGVDVVISAEDTLGATQGRQVCVRPRHRLGVTTLLDNAVASHDWLIGVP
jgi:hypothetical protein